MGSFPGRIKTVVRVVAAGVAVLLLVGPGVAAAEGKKGGLPQTVVDKLVALDNELNDTIILAGHNPPLLKGDDLRSRIDAMHQHKLDALDSGFPLIFGLPYTATFRPLDCVDMNLSSAGAAHGAATSLPSDANADPLAFMRAALQCAQDLLATLQAQGAPADVTTAARGLVTDVTNAVAKVTAGGLSDLAFSDLIESLVTAKERIAKSNGMPKVFGEGYWNSFKFLESIDAHLAVARLLSFGASLDFTVLNIREAALAKDAFLRHFGVTNPRPPEPEPTTTPTPTTQPGRHRHHRHHHGGGGGHTIGCTPPGMMLVDGRCVPIPPPEVPSTTTTTIRHPGGGHHPHGPHPTPHKHGRHGTAPAPSTGSVGARCNASPNPVQLVLNSDSSGEASFSVTCFGLPTGMGIAFSMTASAGCTVTFDPATADADFLGRVTASASATGACRAGSFSVLAQELNPPKTALVAPETFVF